MAPQGEPPPSIKDQIVDSVFDKLQASGQFTDESLHRLRELAIAENLKRAPRVLEALKVADRPAEATPDEAS